MTYDHLIVAGGSGRGTDKGGLGGILRDGGEGGHGGGGGAARVMRLCRALDGLDESLDGGLVVLSTAEVFLAQAAYSFRSLRMTKNYF